MGNATETGRLLSRVYGRLVPIHASLASSPGTVSDDFRRRIVHEIMDILTEIGRDPEFRAADDEEERRRAEAPMPEERAIDERNRQVAARVKQARAKRRARTFA